MSSSFLSRRDVLSLGAASGLAACAQTPQAQLSAHNGFAPFRLSPNRLERITVCLRPFRTSGPRLELEKFGEKTLLHHYGHGGSGWSLSWGAAEDARDLALQNGPPSKIAIVGAGVIGLTTAITLLDAGQDVVIYADRFPKGTMSAWATGVWSPSSRIALSSDMAADYPVLWESQARRSFAKHMTYLNHPSVPVEFIPSHSVPDRSGTKYPPPNHPYLRIGRRVRDLTPDWRNLKADEHPFHAEGVRGGPSLIFNIAKYINVFVQEFKAKGGKMVRRRFASIDDILRLEAPLIVNATGIEAKALLKDDRLHPVRGQINWFPAQPEARYGVYHRRVSAYSRRDGLITQYIGPNDDFGLDDVNKAPDEAQMLLTIERIAPLFAPSRVSA